MLLKWEYLKVLWYINEKIPCSLHVVVLCFHQTVKRQWGRAAAYKWEHTLTSEHSTTWGRDHLLSTCQRSLYIDIYQRNILLNACGVNTDTSRVQRDLESNYRTCYKLWERTTTWAGDIARGKCRIVVNDASEVCQNARCLSWIWIFQILAPTWLSDRR